MSPVKEAIGIARTTNGTRKPEYDKAPNWLRRRVYAAIRARKLPSGLRSASSWEALYHATGELGGRWLDHWGRLKMPNKSWALVSEPYGLYESSWKELELFCDTLGLRFDVSDESWHFPGQTIRITIFE